MLKYNQIVQKNHLILQFGFKMSYYVKIIFLYIFFN